VRACPTAATRLHRYKLILEDENVIMECCSRCKKRLLTDKKYGGKRSNLIYNDEHRRDMLQPGDVRYDREYGTGAIEKLIEARKGKTEAKERMGEREERLKYDIKEG